MDNVEENIIAVLEPYGRLFLKNMTKNDEVVRMAETVVNFYIWHFLEIGNIFDQESELKANGDLYANSFMKLLFIINPGAGKNKTDWKEVITNHFKESEHSLDLYELSPDCSLEKIRKKIRSANPDRVVAVGGDGTLKLVAEAMQGKNIPIGLVPGGSANGMARELGIPVSGTEALDTLLTGEEHRIHLIRINNELCIHLSDMGFNAFVVKKFEDENSRGMWGYVKAAWKVLWRYPRMLVTISLDNGDIRRDAAMVVIANAARYGTGVVINPKGKLDDDRFEVVVVRKISFKEIIKMRFTHKPFDPKKTEIFTTRSLEISSKRRVHFQIDGEYMGKINNITAKIIPDAIKIVVPRKNPQRSNESA